MITGQQDFGVRFGRPDLNSLVVVAKSLVSGSVTVEVAGQTVTVELTAIGTDAPIGHPYYEKQAGFVGSKTISGLETYKFYSYTATQNGNSFSATTITAPAIDDDFIVIPITCDNIESVNAHQDGVGGYTQIRAIAEANPTKGVYLLHIDDHYGYMDYCALDDATTGATGHKVTAATASDGDTVYDFSLGAFAAFGLFSETGNAYCTKPQDDDRQWCMRNLPVLPSMGDHDAGADDMGWNIDPSVAGLSKFTNSQVVWNAFLAPFQGDNLLANTQAWSHTLGCLKIVAPDAISLARGQATTGVALPTGDLYSSAQVVKLIEALDDSEVPFKILSMANGIRYMQDTDPVTEFNAGAQHAIGGNSGFVRYPAVAHADYAQLMTDVGGLMTKSSCNGKMGVLISVHGDHHMAKVVEHKNTDGVNDEWFYGVNVGTINGSVNFDSSVVTVGTAVNGSTPMMADGVYDPTNVDNSGHRWWVVPFSVYGSREIKEIEVDFMDYQGTTLWNKKFTERSMNDAIDVDFNVSEKGSSGSESGVGI